MPYENEAIRAAVSQIITGIGRIDPQAAEILRNSNVVFAPPEIYPKLRFNEEKLIIEKEGHTIILTHPETSRKVFVVHIPREKLFAKEGMRMNGFILLARELERIYYRETGHSPISSEIRSQLAAIRVMKSLGLKNKAVEEFEEGVKKRFEMIESASKRRGIMIREEEEKAKYARAYEQWASREKAVFGIAGIVRKSGISGSRASESTAKKSQLIAKKTLH